MKSGSVRGHPVDDVVEQTPCCSNIFETRAGWPRFGSIRFGPNPVPVRTSSGSHAIPVQNGSGSHRFAGRRPQNGIFWMPMFVPPAGRRPQKGIFWMLMFVPPAGRRPQKGIFWMPKKHPKHRFRFTKGNSSHRFRFTEIPVHTVPVN